MGSPAPGTDLDKFSIDTLGQAVPLSETETRTYMDSLVTPISLCVLRTFTDRVVI